MGFKNAITDEQRLIAGCIDGKPWAQKQVYELYASAMLSVCVRYVTDRETTRDILQEGFIKVFTKAHTYSGTGSFAGWIRRIFVTTALEHIRQNDALKQSVSIDDYNQSIEDANVSVLENISAKDLMRCISELPGGYQTFSIYMPSKDIHMPKLATY
jgi:RNA polymerase sigma factor (sigma-70 family)